MLHPGGHSSAASGACKAFRSSMFILYLRETWVALPPKHYKTFEQCLVSEGMDFVQNGSAKGTPFWKPFSNELQ